MLGAGRNAQLDSLELPDAFDHRSASLRDWSTSTTSEIARLDRDIHRICRDDPGYQAVQAIHGVGRSFAAVFVAEIGDVHRFDSPEALARGPGSRPPPRVRHQGQPGSDHQAGLTPGALGGHRGSGPLPRGGTNRRADFQPIAERRGTEQGHVAVARKVLTLVYYGLRDGEIRCLADRGGVRLGPRPDAAR